MSLLRSHEKPVLRMRSPLTPAERSRCAIRLRSFGTLIGTVSPTAAVNNGWSKGSERGPCDRRSTMGICSDVFPSWKGKTMNTRRMMGMMVIVLMLGSVVWGQEERPQIGVRLDPTPLPELLTKHLGLKPGQGIRIRNVNVGSPADAIGLERDDIIVRFQGEDVMDLDGFVKTVGTAGVGTDVTLEVVHLGQRRTLEFALAPTKKGKSRLKYPPEPEVVTSWQPGKIFRVAPDGEEWVEIEVEDLPDVNVDVKRFFQQLHTYHHVTDGEDYTITIEGDAADENTRITVRDGNAMHAVTIGQLETLPEKYRAPARDAVESAKKSSRGKLRRNKIPLPQPAEAGGLPSLFRESYHSAAGHRTLVREERPGPGETRAADGACCRSGLRNWSSRHQETLERLLDRHREVEEDRSDDEEGTSGAETKPMI